MLYETTRLIIRQHELTDRDAIREILSDPNVIKYNCLNIHTFSGEEIDKYILKMREQLDCFVMVLKESRTVIGEINLEKDSLRYGVDSVMLSYNMNPRYLRQGYMKEAIRGAIDYCFDTKKAVLVSARVFADNEPSKRLLLSLGFIFEGTIRSAVRASDGVVHDDCIFSLFSNENKKSNNTFDL